MGQAKFLMALMLTAFFIVVLDKSWQHLEILDSVTLLCGFAIVSFVGLWPSHVAVNGKIFRYLRWLVSEVVLSTFQVVKLAWDGGKMPATPGVLWIESRQENPVGLVLYANSITLTPGTITISLEGNRLLVHALDRSDLEGLKSGGMDKKVWEFMA